MNDNSNQSRQERHKTPVGTVTTNVRVLEHQVDQERIARRAYAIYESRRREDGHADADWFQAASEYAARLESQSGAFEEYGASDSFGERTRHARR